MPENQRLIAQLNEENLFTFTLILTNLV